MAIKILSLDGLNDAKLCELTARLLETLPGVKSARFDFLSQRLTLDIAGRDAQDVMDDVMRALEQAMPGTAVSFEDVGEHAAPDRARAGRERRPEDVRESEEGAGSLHFNVETSLFLAGLVASGLCFFISLAYPPDQFTSQLLCGIALYLAALFALFFRWSRRRKGYMLTTILSAAAAAVLFHIGESRQAAGAMLLYLLGSIGASMLCDAFDRTAKGLVDLGPQSLRIFRGGEPMQVEVDQVRLEDSVILTMGSRIPFDGVVSEGNGKVDRSLLTGDSSPQEVRAGDPVRCGDHLTQGKLTIMPMPTGQPGQPGQSMARQLSRALCEDPPASPTLLGMQKKTLVWTLALTVLALVTAIQLMTSGTDWVGTTLTLLLLAMPYGVAANFSMAVRTGVARGIRTGVLLCRSAAVDALMHIRHVVTGYTGFLTGGKPVVTGVLTAPGVPAEQVVEYAALAEQGSAHPVARAVIEYYERTGSPKAEERARVRNEQYPGLGARTMVEKRVVLAGSGHLMRDTEIEVPPNESGRPCVYVAERNGYIGMLVLNDAFKPGAAELAQKLRHAGIQKTILLTGCDAEVGLAAQDALGFDGVYSEESSATKPETLRLLVQGAPGGVLFAGGPEDCGLFGNASLSVLLGWNPKDPVPEGVQAVSVSGSVDKLAQLVGIGKRVRGLLYADLGVFAAVKLALLPCVYFFGLPFWAVMLANAALSVWASLHPLIALHSAQEEAGG